ncbi:Zinc finger, DHHC-type, palmitoyltransferase [Carpediemonas membranifera]|uniref:Palmitoyltransferase n=1 Tax=Carpediemonas membranifera TaxID=201153 RepID=A0A8J6BYK0_9EUKA|nr:Zinc finger, DHHC-type, palmitoyltransferase [Carpediemonas membranifera]|eukprot:KAG9394581.1 Zinc finger, DHHC-type, palmitoyltransferase [Carpediemonas membranifera]
MNVIRRVRETLNYMNLRFIQRPNPCFACIYLILWFGSFCLVYVEFMNPYSIPVQQEGFVFDLEQPPFIRDWFSPPESALGIVDFSPLYRVIVPAGYLAAAALFILLVFSDPGFVDRLKPSEKHLLDVPYDNQFYQPQPCVTCQHTKPARSKHCRYCNTCVLRFDHHCVWLNNDVGLFNHGWFLVFLLVHAAGMGLIAVYQYRIFMSLLGGFNLHPNPMSIAVLLRYAAIHMPLFVVVFLFNSVLSVSLGAFFLIHLGMMSADLTTNEIAKRQAVHADLRARRKTYILSDKSVAVGHIPRLGEATAQPLWEISPELYSKPETAQEQLLADRYFELSRQEARVAFLFNPYSEGMVQNLFWTISQTRLRFDCQRAVRKMLFFRNAPYDKRAKEG